MKHREHQDEGNTTKHTTSGRGPAGGRGQSAQTMGLALRPPVELVPLGPPQRKPQGDGAGAADVDAPDLVHQAAAEGTAGASAPLPFLAQIQRSFGRHDVSFVQAHADSRAARGARAMRAEAFAVGEHVAFARLPSLHTAAHEAAHVVQQRAGVQLPGGVGEQGDRYEQHADEVASMVVQGRSAEALLDRFAGPARPPAGVAPIQQQPVQRRIDIMPEHFFSGLNIDYRSKIPSAYLNEYLRIAVWDDLQLVLKFLDDEKGESLMKSFKDLDPDSDPETTLRNLNSLIGKINAVPTRLSNTTTRYATKPDVPYTHMSLIPKQGKEGIKWGDDATMWKEFGKEAGESIANRKYERVDAAGRKALPLHQLPWDEAKRLLPRPLINLIFDVRYQLESRGRNTVVIDERTQSQRSRKDKSPNEAGTLRSWHQDSHGYLPKTGWDPDEHPVPGHAQALHTHYTQSSQSGAGSSIGEGVSGPVGLAEYTGTGSDSEHNTKVVLDYINKRVYLTLTHYQYWALIIEGSTYTFWNSGTQDKDVAEGNLKEFSRGRKDARTILMSPWLEILMPTTDPVVKREGKPESKEDSNNNNNNRQDENKHGAVDDKALPRLIQELPATFKPTHEQQSQARQAIKVAAPDLPKGKDKQPDKTESGTDFTLDKNKVETLYRDNAGTLSETMRTAMIPLSAIVFAVILYYLFS